MSESNFIKAAELKDIPPGKMYRAELQGKVILLANVSGTIYAVDDMCSHEDASLYLGALKGDCVKCSLHGSRFDLKTGEPLDEPADEPIQTYAVKLSGESILVNVN